MKNIKLFKFQDTKAFDKFLDAYDYKLEDIKGFSLDEQKQYKGNVFKTYSIYFNDDEYECFKVVIFKDFNEYHQARLGFRGNKLFDWFEDANVRRYKEGRY